MFEPSPPVLNCIQGAGRALPAPVLNLKNSTLGSILPHPPLNNLRSRLERYMLFIPSVEVSLNQIETLQSLSLRTERANPAQASAGSMHSQTHKTDPQKSKSKYFELYGNENNRSARQKNVEQEGEMVKKKEGKVDKKALSQR